MIDLDNYSSTTTILIVVIVLTVVTDVTLSL